MARPRVLVGLLLLNLLLALVLATRPGETQTVPRGPFDCCTEDGTDSGAAYCCHGCCWLVGDCMTDDDCRDGRGCMASEGGGTGA